jgi:hypothetical protein
VDDQAREHLLERELDVLRRVDASLDREPVDLARREVLAGVLVGLLAEAADELLEDVAHLQVADAIGMQSMSARRAGGRRPTR